MLQHCFHKSQECLHKSQHSLHSSQHHATFDITPIPHSLTSEADSRIAKPEHYPPQPQLDLQNSQPRPHKPQHCLYTPQHCLHKQQHCIHKQPQTRPGGCGARSRSPRGGARADALCRYSAPASLTAAPPPRSLALSLLPSLAPSLPRPLPPFLAQSRWNGPPCLHSLFRSLSLSLLSFRPPAPAPPLPAPPSSFPSPPPPPSPPPSVALQAGGKRGRGRSTPRA
eukprot:2346364-Rhodomonas_salina.1